MPTDTPGGRVLNGVASRGDFFYTSGSIDGQPHVAAYRVTEQNALVLSGEETLPVVEDIAFDKGCWIDGDWLHLAGTDDDDLLYLARKRWARVGTLRGTESAQPRPVGDPGQKQRCLGHVALTAGQRGQAGAPRGVAHGDHAPWLQVGRTGG